MLPVAATGPLIGANGHSTGLGAGPRARTICLVACEVSGDRTAAQLALALRRAAPDVRLLGIGGPAMQAAGVDVRVQAAEFGFVGLLDGLQIAPQLLRLVQRGKRIIVDERPDLVVLIDSELVTTPIALWLRRHRVPAAFFFPPQVWLWGRWRLPAVRPLARRFLSAFADEARLYAASGADTVFVGHPLRDMVQVDRDPAAALRAVGLDPERPVVALMPGSRRHEVRALLGPMLAAAQLLQARDPRLQFAVPLATESLRADLERDPALSRVRALAIYPHDSYAILSRARAVIQCSGTATLEAALLGIPAVIVYRCRPFEYLLGRYLLVHTRFIGMVNILLDECVQPELLQSAVTAERLAAETWSLLTDEARRAAIQRQLAALPGRLGAPGAFTRATEALLELLPERSMFSPPAPVWRPASPSARFGPSGPAGGSALS